MPSKGAAELVEQNRPDGSPDLEFQDGGHTIVLIAGQHCIDESGRFNAVTDSEITRDAPGGAPAKAQEKADAQRRTTEQQRAKAEAATRARIHRGEEQLRETEQVNKENQEENERVNGEQMERRAKEDAERACKANELPETGSNGKKCRQ